MLTTLAPPAGATSVSLSPNAAGGFNFASASTHPEVGYIYKLAFSGGATSLAADESLSVPLSSTTVSVVGVLSAVAWPGTPTSPVQLRGYISVANRNVILALQQATVINTNLTFGFAVFNWDPITQQYFLAFASSGATTGSVLTGQLQKNGLALDWSLSSAPSPFATGSGSGSYYNLSVSIVPPPTTQYFNLNASPTNKLVEPWGTTLGGVVRCSEPRLIGLTLSQARRRLRQHDCGIAVRHIQSGKKRRGRVVRVSGKPGHTYPGGYKIKVYVGT